MSYGGPHTVGQQAGHGGLPAHPGITVMGEKDLQLVNFMARQSWSEHYF